ncbi:MULTISPECIES: cation:proton antiporter [unclassified Synechocystis]|uniref:cation:proton antiporter n=1 Tax=unclassified Synechocystis TaxID=2640012 RepID=UPI000405010B|nr:MULTISPECIES: cation:proton antiporter [unclassified Synechocystis]AIE75255.1 Sodium/hydrogen exchanger [Synechocystis sp. PCC 6714]MCT0252998.1 cation:proton antiporter [Synechocystis sp. CS-94]
MDNNTLLLILANIIIIIGLARLIGLLFGRFQQPPVIGEIIAGIMLGPSLLGLLSPAVEKSLFPPTTQPFLYLLSEIGLIFYMFLVGLELNPQHLRQKLKVAILTSNVSILFPFILGIALSSAILYSLNQPNQTSFIPFALFIGSAMSITAFPVLARILKDTGLDKTPLGTLGLTCASVDDISAWCLLAIAIAATRTNNILGAVPTLLGIIVYTVFMVTLGRKFFKYILRNYGQKNYLSQGLLTFIYIAVILSAMLTEWIGIDVIFGGFILGAILPKNTNLSKELTTKTEDFVSTFLLPIFFAYSGLSTDLGLLNNPTLWAVCALVVTAAIAGKYGGVYLTTRALGVEKQEAKALGWLMNTRGLTELIILNVGLKLGVISPVIFTIFVIMAIVTTLITSPLVTRIYPVPAH